MTMWKSKKTLRLLVLLLLLPAVALGDTLRLDDTDMAVKRMQSRLAVLDYYAGNISGHFGEQTRAAVMAFQRDAGLPESGEADEETLRRLSAMQYRPLCYGMSGDAVTRMQTRLTALSYFTGKISGHYLEATEKAVREFQHKMGLPATGSADERTLVTLFSPEARARGESAVSATAPPTEAPSQDVLAVTDGEDDAPTPAPTLGYTTILQKGATGERVKLVQQRLIDLMYYTGDVTGSYQNKTIAAVKSFQQMNGLRVTGKVDEDTWSMLFTRGRAVPPDATARPTADPKTPPFAVTVDVSNQVVTVYGRDAAGEYTVVVRQMLCSSGTTKNPSDVGDWKLNGHTARWCYFPKWGDYAQYWTRINSSIAFHSVIYNTVNSMDLSVKSYNAIGSRASHGCIRLMVPDAKWVYENVGEGTIVSIREGMPADPELRAALKPAALNRSNMLPKATAVPTAAPVYASGALPPTPLRKLAKKDSGEDVFWLQSKLRELGYYTGAVTGTYLDGTASAVRAFQKASGLKATGTADIATLEALYREELAVPATATPAPTPTPTPAPTPTLTPTPTATPAPTATPSPAA